MRELGVGLWLFDWQALAFLCCLLTHSFRSSLFVKYVLVYIYISAGTCSNQDTCIIKVHGIRIYFSVYRRWRFSFGMQNCSPSAWKRAMCLSWGLENKLAGWREGLLWAHWGAPASQLGSQTEDHWERRRKNNASSCCAWWDSGTQKTQRWGSLTPDYLYDPSSDPGRVN